MNKKAYIISECFQCPYVLKFSNEEIVCDQKEKTIPDPYSIPNWCPLPDAKSKLITSR